MIVVFLLVEPQQVIYSLFVDTRALAVRTFLLSLPDVSERQERLYGSYWNFPQWIPFS